MNRKALHGLISAIMTFGVMAAGSVSESRGWAQSAATLPKAKVVTSTPGPPDPGSPAARPPVALTLVESQPSRKAVQTRALQTLEIGPPPGVADLIAQVNKAKKQRIGFSRFIQRALAEKVAEIAPAPGANETLTMTVNSAINDLTADQVKKILDDKYEAITGTTPPADLQRHIRTQNATATEVLKSAPRARRSG